jgi:isoleucyl-tRNA synthetase
LLLCSLGVEAYDTAGTFTKEQFFAFRAGRFYLDIIKDRQYTTAADSVARRSYQSALFHIAEALVRWTPVLSFTA